jgi:hypothetical protein
VRVYDPGKPVIDVPLRPIRTGRGGQDDGGKGRGDGGGKISRGDGGKLTGSDGGVSNWKRPHLSVLNSFGHGLNVNTATGGNTGPMRTMPLAVGPKVNSVGSVGMVGKGGFNNLR